jgi:ABC-type glutathione transport system ATPase component
MAEALRIENLQVEFRSPAGNVKALNGVSMSQEEGQVYCLVGESGAGKSTLALAIMGLLPHSASGLQGSVYFRGVDLLRSPARNTFAACEGKKYLWCSKMPSLPSTLLKPSVRNLKRSSSSTAMFR